MKRETWAKVIFGIALFLVINFVSYMLFFGSKPGGEIRGSAYEPLAYIQGFLVLFLIPAAIVLLFLWSKFVGFQGGGKKKEYGKGYKQVLEQDKTLSGKLASLFSNWRFWATTILVLIIMFVSILADEGRMGYGGALIISLMFLAGVGSGLFYFLPERLYIANPSGIQIIWNWFLSTVPPLIIAFYWPIIFVAIVAMLSKRLNKRLLIVIGIITLLLLVAGFYGCAMQAADVAKGPW